MTSERRPNPIRVYRHQSQSYKLGYRWECDLCPSSGGFHRFDRWTDYVRAKQNKPFSHPWLRAMEAANLHYHRYHAPRGVNIDVTIHQLNINN